MPWGLSFCTSEDVRSLLGRGLAVLAKIEWSGVHHEASSFIFSSLKRYKKWERSEGWELPRVSEVWQGKACCSSILSFSLFLQDMLHYSSISCVSVYVHALVFCRLKSGTWWSEHWRSPRSQPVPGPLSVCSHFGRELDNGNKHTQRVASVSSACWLKAAP